MVSNHSITTSAAAPHLSLKSVLKPSLALQKQTTTLAKISRIGVFPAAGGLGGSIIKHLLNLVPASQLTLVARKPDTLSYAADSGTTVRYADYDQPESLNKAFDGVDVLMLISYPSFEIEHRAQVDSSSPNQNAI